MAAKVNDSYTVLLREKKLPLQLLEDPEKKVGGKQVGSGHVHRAQATSVPASIL